MTDTLLSLDESLTTITDTSPLVVSYTNDVTIDAVANTTLHWGGLPVMSVDEREAADMLGPARACLINMGTVNGATEELMITAGRAAARQEVPVVFDPVGVGATPTRNRIAERIIDVVDVSIVKGNHGEITALTGNDAEVRGVESVGEYGDIAETAIACARATDAVVVASGETDVIATGERAYELTAGNAMMGQFVGSGCMLGATLATFVGGLGKDRTVTAATTGTAAFGIAGELAATTDVWDGPASYKVAFLDAIANMEAGALDDMDEAERLTVIAD